MLWYYGYVNHNSIIIADTVIRQVTALEITRVIDLFCRKTIQKIKSLIQNVLKKTLKKEILNVQF